MILHSGRSPSGPGFDSRISSRMIGIGFGVVEIIACGLGLPIRGQETTSFPIRPVGDEPQMSVALVAPYLNAQAYEGRGHTDSTLQ